MAKDAAPAGAPMWMVTFADLMSLLVCFFVLIISFSVPDTDKVKIVAGSMRDAFGFSKEIVATGMVEIDGNPRYKYARDLVPIPLDTVTGPIDQDGREVIFQQPGWRELDEDALSEISEDFEEAELEPLDEDTQFDQLEEALEDLIRDNEALKELAASLDVARVPEGLRIQLIDQEKISMFPLGSTRMVARAQELLAKVVGAIEGVPNSISIVGHTDAIAFRHRKDHYDNWSLSVDRADATRKVLEEAGLDMSRVASVTGRAATEHLIPEDPADPRNRRISITLLSRPLPPVSSNAGSEQVTDGQ